MKFSFWSNRSIIGTVLASRNRQQGFTLVEVLVSAAVILIAMTGGIVAFNVITQSLRGTGLRADQSRRIDGQIAEISRIAEIYTACGNATGAVPADPVTPLTACAGSTTDVQAGNSFYFFPDPANVANVTAFFTACRSTNPADHITANFMTAINGIGAPGGDVTRQASTRVNGADASNHIVQVDWIDPANRVLRRFRISPLLSAWCP